MAALTDSGELSLDDIIKNRTAAAGTNVSLKDNSILFASGSDANDRGTLNQAPYSISEFYDANYPAYFDTVVAKVGTTAVTSNGYVDGETGRIYFTVQTSDPAGTQTYTAGLKYANHTIAASATNTDQTTGTRYITITAPTTTAGSDKYYPFLSADGGGVIGTYTNATAEPIDHYVQIAGGSAGLSETSRAVDAADESVSNISITPTVSTGVQTGYARGSISSVTAGDGGTMTGVYVQEEGQDTDAVVIANVPGVIRFAITHYGNPSNARNTVASTTDYTVSYNLAIDGVASDDHTVNSGTEFTITAISEGLTSTTTMRMGYAASNSNTTYADSSDKSISTSQFVRSTQTAAFTRNLTSGTALETYYPKAHYTSGTATITAGSALYIAPAYSYSTTGDQTLNVSTTQAFTVSSVVGNGSSVAITSSPNIASPINAI